MAGQEVAQVEVVVVEVVVVVRLLRNHYWLEGLQGD